MKIHKIEYQITIYKMNQVTDKQYVIFKKHLIQLDA